MPETPPPPEDDVPHGPLIDEGGWLTNVLMIRLREALAARAGQLLAIPVLRSLMRDYLLPAEAALRRAIHLIAATLPPVEDRSHAAGRLPGARPSQGNRSAISDPSKPRTPSFRLTESLPRPPTNYIPVSQRPRISIAGDPPPPARAPEPYTVRAERLEARLRRRLAALMAAWDDPQRTAERLQRLRARGRIRTPALSFLKIPGARAETLGELGTRILRELNRTAFEESLRLRADTS